MSWVGANRTSRLVTPTVDTAAYASNDCIGVLIETGNSGSAPNGPVIERGGSGKISRAWLFDKSSQIHTHRISAYIFRDNPSASTFTDQAAFAIHDDDLTKLEAIITFDEAHDGVFASSSANQAIWVPLAIPYECSSDSLYIVFKADGSTPTFGASSDLSMRLLFERD